jgi:uncharacterized membrane protein YbhN (UPF0104 family)
VISLSPRQWRLLRIAALVAVTVALVLALRGIAWSRAVESLRQATVSWIAAAVTANTLINVAWAGFWRALRPKGEPPVTFGRMFEVTATAGSLMNTLPFGGGHASSIVLLVRRTGMSRGGALSLLALDQLGEGIVKVTVFLLAALLVPLPAWMRASVGTVCAAVAAWLVVMLIASRWTSALDVIRSPGRAGAALASVALMKVAEGLAMAAVARAYGVNASAAATLLALSAALLASMLPVSPGNLGTYEAAVVLAYRHLGVPAELALSVAVVQHAAFMLPSVGIGYLFFSAQTVARRAVEGDPSLGAS